MLKSTGIPELASLAALIKQYNANTQNANIFDGRISTLKITDNGVTKTVSAYASENKEKYGAFVSNGVGPGGSNVTFLSHYFFNPPSIDHVAQQRAIILLHEAVHQFANQKDSAFGGSRELSEKIIKGCFPVLAGKLGGVG